MSVILPSRLSWALSDRPTRSKGMWYGILGAFIAGIAVASVAGNIPKVAEGPSVTPEMAPVAVKVTPPKVASTEGQPSAPKAANKPAGVANKANTDVRPAPQIALNEVSSSDKPASDQPAPAKPAGDQPVRVIGADRITPPPGADTAPLASPTSTPAQTPAVAVAPSEPARTGSANSGSAETRFPSNSHEWANGDVPMPRDKPASLHAAAPADARQAQNSVEEVRPAQEVTVTASILEAPPSEIAPVAITGRVPMPRVKPVIEEPEIEVAAREPDDLDRASPSRLQGEDGRTPRFERRDYSRDYSRDYDRRPAVYDRRPVVMESRREMRRMERAEARAAERRAREVHRRNEAEGFELVRSYRGPDGRRVSVYQRMEPRVVAYQARPLFGRPAYLMPPRGYWR